VSSKSLSWAAMGTSVFIGSFTFDVMPQWMGVIAMLACAHIMIQDLFFDTASPASRTVVQQVAQQLEERLGEAALERLSQEISNTPCPLDETVKIGELLDERDREWLAEELKRATELHN
jgi:hypothetical protein